MNDNKCEFCKGTGKEPGEAECVWCHSTGTKEGQKLLTPPAEQHQGDAIGTLHRSQATEYGRIIFTPIGDPHIKDGMRVYTHADPGEAERFEKLYTQALSRQADIGVELAVAHELLRKAFFALLKAGHSKPLREHIKKILPIALCSTCNGYGKYQDGDSGTDEDGRAPNIVECDCDDSERMPQYRSNAEPSAPKCETCNGLGHVPDGEITGVGNVKFENGPVECIKDCPDCTPSAPVERDERAAITMEQVLRAYDYAGSHPHQYLRGTTNWCAAVAHSLNEQARAALERKQ